MNDVAKIGVSHLHRVAYVYLRQSSPAQVEHNRESTERQYELASKATALGWPSQQVVVIDEDLGVSGTGVVEAFALQTSCAPALLNKLQTATSPCTKRCASWVFPDKRCCNVSSVVRSKLSTSNRAVKKACVSR